MAMILFLFGKGDNMPGRASYNNEHADEKRRREGALERLEKQLAALKANDEKALFLKKGQAVSKDLFKAKIEYVSKQIEIVKGKK